MVVPDVHNVFAELISSDDEEADRVLETHPSLLDPAWAPVYGAVKQNMMAQLDNHAQARAQRRVVRLNRGRWPYDPVDEGAFGRLDPAVQEILNGSIRSDELDAADKLALLNRLTRVLDEVPDERAVIVEYLMLFLIRTYESPRRLMADVETAVAIGRTVVPLAVEVFGDAHPMTVIITQDFAAALVDRRGDDHEADREEAIDLLTRLVKVTVDAKDPTLADILQNLGAAYAHRTVGSRTDNQRTAEQYCMWALHTARTLTPHKSPSIRLAEIALATVRRERREGDRGRQAADAHQTFEDTLRQADLQDAEQTTILSSKMTALHQRRLLDPESVARSEVMAAVEACVGSARALPAGHPTRIQTLTNAGSVLSEIYHEDGYVDLALLEQATELTGMAHTEAKDAFGAGNPETLRVGLNHAALLGMPVRIDGRSGIRYHDGDTSGRMLRKLLDACPTDRLPAHAAVIANNLGRYLCGTGRWTEATEAFRTAMSAVAGLYRSAPDAEARLAELGSPTELSWSTLAGWLVSASLQAEDYAGALSAIEESRAKLLSDRLRLRIPSPTPGPRATDGDVLYLGISPLSSWAILVPAAGRIVISVANLALRAVRPAVRELRRAQDPATRSAAFAELAGILRPHVTKPAYDMLVAAGTPDVAIVPSGLLSGLPLHAMPATDDGACLLDLCTVRYIPSASIARHIEAAPTSRATKAVAVADRDGLSFAEYEAALLGKVFGDIRVAPPTGDRKRWLLNELPGTAQLLVSCHAQWLENDPLRSPIYLDERSEVSFAELLALAGGAPDFVILSACETGVTVESLADEVLGFGTAMLLADTRATVVSNWRIRDRAAALLLALFYEEVATGVEFASALRTSQLWLARLTYSDLVALGAGEPAQGRRPALPAGMADELMALEISKEFRETPDTRPYADPVHWGGLSYFGTRMRLTAGVGDGAP
jgi:CHAT domain-containing protein